MIRRFPLVLCYHATSDTWDHLLSAPPAMLAKQVSALLRFYRPASAETVVAGTQRTLHVTFDDAYRSVANVVPTLLRLGVPATVFACSGYADDGRPLAVPELAAEAGARPDELATMGWDELRGLAESGIEIGSHTVSHPHLTDLDDGELARELKDSRLRLEDELGRPCRYLAYPYGDEDGRVRKAASAAGYRAGFALRADPAKHDPFQVPRLGLWRHDRTFRAAAKVVLRRDHKSEVRRAG